MRKHRTATKKRPHKIGKPLLFLRRLPEQVRARTKEIGIPGRGAHRCPEAFGAWQIRKGSRQGTWHEQVERPQMADAGISRGMRAAYAASMMACLEAETRMPLRKFKPTLSRRPFVSYPSFLHYIGWEYLCLRISSKWEFGDSRLPLPRFVP